MQSAANGVEVSERLQSGRDAISRALEFDESRAEVWAERAHLEMLAGRVDQARSAATTARSLNRLVELPEELAAPSDL